MSAHGNSTKVIVIALVANLGIALSKYAGAFFTRSASLLAEAIHSTVDCANQVLLLVGAKQSKKAPTEKHPLGFGREAFFWSFMVAILLFSLGGLFAIYEGIHKLSATKPVDHPALGLGILVFGLVLEAVSFKAVLTEVRHQNPFGSLWLWFRHTTSADLLVVFTEDLAALLGLGLATLCLLAAWATGNPRWDALGSILVGALLVIVAFFLALEIKSLIVGESPATSYRPGIEEILSQAIPQGRLLRLIVIQTGTDEVMLSCKITPGSLRDVEQLVTAINTLEKQIKSKYPEVRWQFIEPDFEP